MSGRLVPYPSYRDSGIEWIGDVPQSWSVLATSRISDLTTGERDTQDAVEEGAYPFFVRSQTVERIDTYSFNGEGVLTSGDGAGVGKIFHHFVGKFEFHQRVYLFHNFRRTLGRYFFYFFREHLHLVALAGNAKSTVDSLRRPMLRMFPICLPSVEEQARIVEFLDYETAKIDKLIDKQQQLIALLKEKRQAVISHAVTKGLNPEAPMKDSGVEWLGKVPAHWEVAQLGHKTHEVTVGIVQTPAKFYQDDGVPCLRSLNVRPGYLRAEELVFISPAANDMHEKSKIYREDLVVVRTGQPGTTAAVDERFDGCNCIDLIIVRKSSEILSNFLVYLMNSEFAAIQVAAGSGGAIQQHFNVGIAKKLRVIVPPLEEQHLIVGFLDTRTAKLDKLVGNAERTVDLLTERRSALISAAVTGKIDVRNWRPPETDAAQEVA